MEGPRPDKFQFAVLVPAGFGAGTPQQEAVLKGQEFSGIENLWPRDDSCPHAFRKRFLEN